MKTALLIYPHQLFTPEVLPEVKSIVVVEEPLYFGTDQQYPADFHAQKLVLHRASMRRYVEEVLWPAGYEVEYIEHHRIIESGDIIAKLKDFEHLLVFDPVNEILLARLQKAGHDIPGAPTIEVLASPNFYLKRSEVLGYFADKKNHHFNDFYQWQRERFNILIDENYHPVGGAWTIEAERTKLDAGQQLPTFEVFGDNKHVIEAREYVSAHFPDNQSDDSDFPWPTSHAEATQWLDNFVEHRLDDYARYQDAIDGQAVWLYHSALSSSLNIGLLDPHQIVDRALARHKKKPVELASLEGFIRQILGWREYDRGVYDRTPQPAKPANVFKHTRHLTADWYNGTTGLPPLDDVIKKVGLRAYAHHAERQMVLGTMMLLAEINPEEVRKYFKELFIDAYDWVPAPDTEALTGLASAAGTSAVDFPRTADEILGRSNYHPGDWCDTWDGLYWRFIEKNKDTLSKHHYLSQAVTDLANLDPARQRVIGYRAEDFLTAKTRA